MKKMLLGTLIGVWLGGLSLTTYAAVSNQEKEIVLAVDNWCPYTCSPETSAQPGYLIDIINRVLKPKGYHINFKFMEWHKAIEEARAGHIDGLLGTYKGDVPDFVFPDQELGRSVVAFFVRKENPWTYTGVASLNKITLGIIDGYDYGSPEVREYISKYRNTPKVQVMQGSDALKKNITNVYFGRIGTTPEDIAVTTHMLRNLQYSHQLKQAGLLGKPNEVYVAFSPRLAHSAQYAQLISEGMVELKKSGKLQHILNAYGLSNWESIR